MILQHFISNTNVQPAIETFQHHAALKYTDGVMVAELSAHAKYRLQTKPLNELKG